MWCSLMQKSEGTKVTSLPNSQVRRTPVRSTGGIIRGWLNGGKPRSPLSARNVQNGGSGKGRLAASPQARLLLIWGVLIASGCGIALNLYHLQIVRSSVLLKRARQQQMFYLRPFTPRRPVTDRNNNMLAIDRLVYTLYAHPKLFKASKAAIALRLAPILNQPEADLLKEFNLRDSGIRISPALSEEMADRIAAMHNDGLELIQQYSRLYPQQDLVADVVGYVDLDRRGQAGVEYSQEKLLERSVQTVRLSRSGNGVLMPDHIPEGFLHFDDLQLRLTIDSGLQRAARFALKQQLKKFGAKRGTVIVMDAQDGSLLALVAEPTYDPNQYYKSQVGLFKNWSLSDLYEPGSTFKPLNVAIALESGAVQPDSVFRDGDQIYVAGWPIKNAEGENHGLMTVAQILKYSSNIGMVRMMQQVRPALYYGWLERLGLGQMTKTDLPFEVPSYLKSREQFLASPVERATASFGQGFTLTPLQLVQMHGALANGGKLVTPHVVRGLFNSKGQLYWQPTFPAPRPIFSPQTTQTVIEMMENVVKDGTGKAAAIQGYRIAGKTGTAQKANPHGGYYSSTQITSFVGILPAESPRYVVLAVVDEPRGNVFGSTVAAPVVKSVMDALITTERIPPSSH